MFLFLVDFSMGPLNKNRDVLPRYLRYDIL
jgi:hypothetical protein